MFSRLVFRMYQKKIYFNSIRTFQHCGTCKTKSNCEKLKRCIEYDDDDDDYYEAYFMNSYRKNNDFQNTSNTTHTHNSIFFSSSNNHLSSNSNSSFDISDDLDGSDNSDD
jgi:hypothetical protein